MFCSQCGVKASGKYCHQCGSLLQSPDSVVVLRDEDLVPDPKDWETDAQYENIVRVEAVRTVIARHAAHATKGLSAEQILAIYDKIAPSPIPLENLVALVQPLYESWGIRTGKNRSELIETPIGRAIARTLCSLAKHGQTFQSAEQHDSGCVLTAELPSSVCSLKGKLTISLLRRERCTQVAAATAIGGQVYDWGKSKRCLEQLFGDLRSDLGLPPSYGQRQVA
jgi:hypothetical protein